jgi:hypothetical protein
LGIQKLTEGLHILNEESQYRRQTLRTTGADYSWVGGTYPKTYSFTVSEAPAVPNYEVVMYFSPYSDYPNSFPDYARENCGVLRLAYSGGSPGAGSPQLTFAYKLNSPAGNGPTGNSIYDTDSVPSSGLGGRLAAVSDTSFTGTWSITFTSAEDFTLTSPTGTTATGAMLPATSAIFVNPMMVGVGTFNGADTATRANGANECVFSNIKIPSPTDPINDNFPTSVLNPLFTNAGETNSANFLVTPDTSFFVKRSGGTAWWLFQESSDLGVTDTWEYRLSGTISVGSSSMLPVSAVDVSANAKDFWRLLLDAPLAPQAP